MTFSFVAPRLPRQMDSCIVPQLEAIGTKVCKTHLRTAQQNVLAPKFLYGSEIFKRQSSVDELKANYFYQKIDKTSAETFSLTFLAP